MPDGSKKPAAAQLFGSAWSRTGMETLSRRVICITSGRSPLTTRIPTRRFADSISADARTWASSIFAVIRVAIGRGRTARELVKDGDPARSEIGHVGAIADALFWKSYLEIWRGDPLDDAERGRGSGAVAREHGMVQYLNEAELHSGWARGRINDPTSWRRPSFDGAARPSSIRASGSTWGSTADCWRSLRRKPWAWRARWRASTRLSRLSEQIEQRCSLPFLHRLRGEILLKRDPPDPAARRGSASRPPSR